MPFDSASIDRPAVVLAAAATGTAAVIVFALLPVIAGVMADRYALDDVQIGLVATAYFSLYAVVALSSVLWIRRYDWVFVVRSGFVGMLSGLMLCLATEDYRVAVVGFAFVGLSAGLLFPVSLALVSDMAQTERNYALKLAAEQLVPAGVLFLLSSSLLGSYGMGTLFTALILVIVLCALAAFRLPRAGRTAAHQPARRSGALTMAVLSLVALAINFAGFAGLWAFLERIAVESNLTAKFTALWLGVGLITSGIGPLIAAAVGERLGRVGPLGLSTLVGLATLVLLSGPVGKTEYALVLTILPLGYYFSIAYLYGIVADADHNGRMAGLMSFALAVGAASGPALFGSIKTNGGPVVLVMGCLIAAGAALAIVIQLKLSSLRPAHDANH